MWSNANGAANDEFILVVLPPYRRILDKSDDTEIESAVRALFSDVLKTEETIIIQVEGKWVNSMHI